MFKWLRWYMARRRLAVPRYVPPDGLQLSLLVNDRKVEDLPPSAEPYEKLASIWDAVASSSIPDYASFLASIEIYFAFPVGTVLDLACGTGILARQFANKIVVGLDAAETMVREAHSRSIGDKHRFLQADFRSFRLDTVFDACLCVGDSLNYLAVPEELDKVFLCVHAHLRPGGFFVFDALDHEACQALAFAKMIGQIRGELFEVFYFYDSVRHLGECRARIGSAVERHRRIPIEDRDVRRSAKNSGLDVMNEFRTTGYRYSRQFYVLRKPV